MSLNPPERLGLYARPLGAETFNQTMTNWLDASEPRHAELFERIAFSWIAPASPAFSSLMVRAHARVEQAEAELAVAYELLTRTVGAMATVARELRRFEGDDPEGLERFMELAHAAMAEMAVVLAADATVGELDAVCRLLDHDDVHTALELEPCSTVTLVFVILGDGTSYAARTGVFHEPLLTRRDKVVRVAEMMTRAQLHDALAAWARLLTALTTQMPTDRWRAMLSRPERGGDKCAARPGIGFIGIAELAAWKGNSVRAVRSKNSRTLSACANAYADPRAPITRPESVHLTTSTWITNYQEGR